MALVPLLTQSARRMVPALLTCWAVRPLATAAVFRHWRWASGLPMITLRAFWRSCCWVMVGSGVELVQCSRSGGVERGQRVPPPQVSLFRSEGALQGERFQFLVVTPGEVLLLTLQVFPEGFLFVNLEVVGEAESGHGVNPSGTKVVLHGVGGLGNPPVCQLLRRQPGSVGRLGWSG